MKTLRICGFILAVLNQSLHGQESNISAKKYIVFFEEHIKSNYASLTHLFSSPASGNDSLTDVFENKYLVSVREFWLPSKQDSLSSVLVRIEFLQLDCKRNGIPDSIRYRQLTDNQNQFFGIEKSRRDGSIRRLIFAPATAPAFIGLVRTLWSSSQVVQPGRNKESWEGIEDQAAGPVRFRYQWQHDTLYKIPIMVNEVLKKGTVDSIHSYRHFFVANPPHNQLKEIALERTFSQFIQGRRIAKVTQKLHAYTTPENSVMEKNTVYGIEEANRLLRQHGQMVSLRATLSMDERRKAIYQGTLKGRTWAQLKNELPKIESFPTSNCFDLISQVCAFLVLFPEQTDSVRLSVDKWQHDPKVFLVLSHALIEAETPTAWQAVGEIIQKYSWEKNAFKTYLPKLALAQNVPQYICRKLLKMRLTAPGQSLQNQSGLTLSCILKNSYKDTDFADSIATVLLKRLQTFTASSEDTLQLLNELGNYGSNTFLDFIERALTSSNDIVRATAAYSLRFLKDTDRQLMAVYQNNAEYIIRKNALEALEARAKTPTSLQFIANEICREQNKSLAKHMISMLKKAADNGMNVFRYIDIARCTPEVKKWIDETFPH